MRLSGLLNCRDCLQIYLILPHYNSAVELVVRRRSLRPPYRELCFAMGPPDSSPVAMGQLLPTVRAIAAEVRARVVA